MLVNLVSISKTIYDGELRNNYMKGDILGAKKHALMETEVWLSTVAKISDSTLRRDILKAAGLGELYHKYTSARGKRQRKSRRKSANKSTAKKTTCTGITHQKCMRKKDCEFVNGKKRKFCRNKTNKKRKIVKAQ